MKRNSLLFIPLLIVAIAFGAYAQRGPIPNGGPNGGPGVPGFGGPGASDSLAEYLGLTSEQKTAWETIQSDLRTTIEGLHAQERTLGEQLHTALDAGSTDATALGTLLIQMRAIQTQIETARDAADAKFEASLTAEQKVKYAAFQAASAFLRQRGPGGPH
ncbi:MAG TPA: Spy/CpxP family protein refolding chaperone [Thermoanaerobaculia bacterium]|nr:Spy/CpxP family protein refolding chaperone [Thermoanaerobaculia bacterium]